MPSLEDIRLGQLSVAQGLCQPLEVEECLALQHHNERNGPTDPLGELMIRRGYITRTQLTRLLNIQREAEQRVSKIGVYDLIRKLGEGGMGAVYQAKDSRNNEMVALKVLPRSRAKDKIFLQRFEQEARAAFELDHPNIVHGLDVGNADGYHFLVMEFVHGQDVYQMLEQKGRFPEAEALNILEQVASALDHIHGERLVHRDIKPENIIVSEKGVAKLADMGLAVDNETQGRRRITQAGVAMGTPFYLSPEQIEGKSEVDIRSDIYALGTTVYEMVTGRPPFDGETPAVVMMKHLNEQVPSPHDIDRTITLGFCHMLERMMAKNPAERYQSPGELIADLKRLRNGESPIGTRPAAGRSSVSRPVLHRESGKMLTPERAKERERERERDREKEHEKPSESHDALGALLTVPSGGGPYDSRQGVARARRPAGSPGAPSRSRAQLPVATVPAAERMTSVKIAVMVGVGVALLALVWFFLWRL